MHKSVSLTWLATVMVPAGSHASPRESRTRSQKSRAIISDVQKIVTRGIDETLVLTLGGARQVVNIRGPDRTNPILIYIHGGSGSGECQ